MPLDRRSFLVRTGLAIPAQVLAARAARARGRAAPQAAAHYPNWRTVRSQFNLSRDYVHLGGLLFASHPKPVRDAIERHRRGLDRNPVHYLYDNRWDFEADVLNAAAAHLGVEADEIALTDSTTMGLATLYAGLRLREGQEVVTTVHDHYSTRESLRLRAEHTGASVREITLYERLEAVSEDEIVASVRGAIGPQTRAVALTWVHSSTGLKLPIRRIADSLAELNAGREQNDRILLCVDGVHAFGVDDATMADLGCDFFVAGCHKWLLGPRGTGLVWGRADAWAAASPTIPTFTGSSTPGRMMTPGGFHSFEHRWALAEAFEFHRVIGKARVAARIHELASALKEGLAGMDHVTVHTPRASALSAGLICFEVGGMDQDDAAERLRDRRIIASVAPYANRYLRFSPGLANSHADVDRALRAVRALAAD